MADQTKTKECIAPGLRHTMQFTTAAHGYQCFICAVCGHTEDIVEDSQP